MILGDFRNFNLFIGVLTRSALKLNFDALKKQIVTFFTSFDKYYLL